jgi:WD40 repeat protein
MRFVSRSVVCLCLLAVMVLAYGSAGAQGERAKFSGAPEIGNRMITLRWNPLQDGTLGVDPFYEGNTVIRAGTTWLSAYRFRFLRTNTLATRLYGVSDDDSIRICLSSNGTLQQTLGAPPSPITDIDVREGNWDRKEVLILASLADGRAAIWDLRDLGAGKNPQIMGAHVYACRHIRFLVTVSAMDEQRFVTTGVDSSGPDHHQANMISIWQSPGALRFKINTETYVDSAMAITENASYLAVGYVDGSLRVYEPLKFSSQPRMLSVANGHVNPVTRLQFSRDTRTLLSADASGKAIIWSTVTWQPVTILDPVAGHLAGSPEIGLRDPDAALAYVIDKDGLFRVFDGREPRVGPYNEEVVGTGIISATFGNSGKNLILSQNDRTIRGWRTGFCSASLDDPSCFGGYMIWRSTTPNPEDAVLLRVYGFGDSTWSFVGSTRAFVDPDSMVLRGAFPIDENHPLEIPAGPHNGVPYYYSITDYAMRFAGGSTFAVGKDMASIRHGFYRANGDTVGPPTPVIPHSDAVQSKPLLKSVIVVPNPYETGGRVPWDAALGEHVEFRNLPEQATIRIYSLGGDFVREIEHGRGAFGESTDVSVWDLKNTSGEPVTSGVYIYHIVTKLGREKADGYLTLIR